MKSNYVLSIFFRLLMVSSILAPAVVTLVESSSEKFLLVDNNDEESKKETEKELEEKKLFFEYNLPHKSDFFNQENTAMVIYLFSYQGLQSEIFLPPPESKV